MVASCQPIYESVSLSPAFVTIVYYFTFPSHVSSHQQLPENLSRALTLADLVKQIVTGNPSRTLWYAATDMSRNLLGEEANSVDGLKYLGSGGTALEEADRALYSGSRPANQRIHWTFSPMKDDRVAQLLDWIQVMSYALGTLGVSKTVSGQRVHCFILQSLLAAEFSCHSAKRSAHKQRRVP